MQNIILATVIALQISVVANGADKPPMPASPEPSDYWQINTECGAIVHENGSAGGAPVVVCMQGLKVVMQTRVDSTNGLTYRARFFNVDPDLTSKGMIITDIGADTYPVIKVNGKPLKFATPLTTTFDGMLTVVHPETEGAVLTRTVYPSTKNPAVIDEWNLKNASSKPIKIEVSMTGYTNSPTTNTIVTRILKGLPSTEVKPGATVSAACILSARSNTPADVYTTLNVDAERSERRNLMEKALCGPGRLETPDAMLDMAFALQKLHVLESPIETVYGVITHNGSLTYSPGIWANDPVEYSSPLFPFFGSKELDKAGIAMYRIWMDFCKTNGIVPFPGSFESPALRLCQKERGDDAMVLYGLSKFLLFLGDRSAAEELWPLIEFSAASIQSHTTADGIVASQTDEMEDRYPTGDANLSTSALAYGGYRQTAWLAKALNKPAAEYDARADKLNTAIERYFGAEVEGFKTYRYYTNNTTLRGWILLPLAMGITNRQEATVAALISDKLWPDRSKGADILAESTRPTEWGRETYYALRTLFKAGHTEEAIDLTRRVVKAQIFGPRGPYPDEDAIDMLCPGSLYPRVFIEGMFGIVPTGLNSFECTPRLPASWPRMALRDVRAFGRSWDIVVEKSGTGQKVTVRAGGQTIFSQSGQTGITHRITFPE